MRIGCIDVGVGVGVGVGVLGTDVVGMADVGMGCCGAVGNSAHIAHDAWALGIDCDVL